MLLDGVIGQVDCSIIDVLRIYAILRAGSSDVPFFEEIEVRILVVEHPNANVKLAAADEEGSLYVLLYDEGIVLDLVSAF